MYHVIVKSQDGSIIVDVNTTDTLDQLSSNVTVCSIYTSSVRAIIAQYSSLTTKTTEQNTGSKIISIIDLTSYCKISLYYSCNKIQQLRKFHTMDKTLDVAQ